LLKEEIEFRVRVFTRCLSKTSESYVKWLQDDYKRKLKVTLIRHAHEVPEGDIRDSSSTTPGSELLPEQKDDGKTFS